MKPCAPEPRDAERQPHVVIVGGGFAGLQAARSLADSPVRVTLVDRRNHHLFQPLLYQVATAALSPANIAQPLRHLLHRYHNIHVDMAEVNSVDIAKHTVELADTSIQYDYLILATGATDNYFGHDEWSEVAPGLKSLESAVYIRSRFLVAFEKAVRECDVRRRRALLTFVVIGAGPTGVELAGTMAEISRAMLATDFLELSACTPRTVLLEAAPRVLPAWSETASEKARQQLERLGVEVRTGHAVASLAPGMVTVEGERIESETVIWSAGVRASDLGRTLGVSLGKGGRVVVGSDLSLPGHAEVFVVGDLAHVRGVPGVAPAAMQMGRHAADCIRRDLQGQARLPFVYRSRGNLATVGRGAAVAEFGRFRLAGFAAWLAWLVVHLYFLIGFENRLMVLLQWAWAYLYGIRSARIITWNPGDLAQAQRPRCAQGP